MSINCKDDIRRSRELDQKVMQLRLDGDIPETYEGYVAQAKKYLSESEFAEYCRLHDLDAIMSIEDKLKNNES